MEYELVQKKGKGHSFFHPVTPLTEVVVWWQVVGEWERLREKSAVLAQIAEWRLTPPDS